MKMHMHPIATIGKGNTFLVMGKGKEEKYVTCPSEKMNHRNWNGKGLLCIEDYHLGKADSHVYFRLHSSAFTPFFQQ